MKFRFFITVSVWVSLPWAFLSAQNTYTLEQCLLASDTHTPLARQQALIDAAHSTAIALLNNNYLPQATLNGQASWQSEVTSIPISVPGFEVTPLSRDQYRATLEVVQPIWDAGQTARQKEIQSVLTLSEQQRLRVDRYTLREQTMQLYCAVLLAKKQRESLATAIKDTQSKKKRVEEQLANGTAIPATVYSFEVRLFEIEQQIADAEARIKGATAALAVLTGLSMSENDRFEQPRTQVPADTKIERAELGYYKLQQQASAVQALALKSKSLPRINAFATLGYARPGLNFLSNDFAPYAIFGANFKWNLSPFFTNSISKERQQLRIQSDRIATQHDQFVLLTELRQSQQQAEIDRLATVLERDQRIMELREKIVATAAVQLENGVLTPSEYLTESTLEVNARLNTAIHEIQRLQAMLQLQFTQGTL